MKTALLALGLLLLAATLLLALGLQALPPSYAAIGLFLIAVLMGLALYHLNP